MFDADAYDREMKLSAWIAVLGTALLCGCPQFQSPDITGVYVHSSTNKINTLAEVFDFRGDGTSVRNAKLSSPTVGMMDFNTRGSWKIVAGKLLFEGHKTTITATSEGLAPQESVSDTDARFEFSVEANGDLINGTSGHRFIKQK